MILALLAFARPMLATYGQGNPRLQRLYSMFMSPCCWQQNLTLHDSPVADQLRARISRMVREGHSDEEIKTVLIGEYGKRILALPEGVERVWLFVTPWAVGAAGLILLCAVIGRFRFKGSVHAGAGFAPAEVNEDWFEQ